MSSVEEQPHDSMRKPHNIASLILLILFSSIVLCEKSMFCKVTVIIKCQIQGYKMYGISLKTWHASVGHNRQLKFHMKTRRFTILCSSKRQLNVWSTSSYTFSNMKSRSSKIFSNSDYNLANTEASYCNEQNYMLRIRIMTNNRLFEKGSPLKIWTNSENCLTDLK